MNDLNLSAEDNKNVKECGQKMNESGVKTSKAVSSATSFKPSPSPDARSALEVTAQPKPNELLK